jgi:hypothetical protein
MVAHRRRSCQVASSRTALEQIAAAVPPPLAEAQLLIGLRRGARRDWCAAAFLLERRWPERWAPVHLRAVAQAATEFLDPTELAPPQD